jgi:protein ImuA
MAQPISPQALAVLRETLARLGGRSAGADPARFALGHPALDGPLGGGLARGALHEVFAAGEADVAAATGFAAALAVRAARTGAGAVIWVRQDFLDVEAGALHGPGLAAMGLDPARVVLVRARDVAGVLKAGDEAARSPAPGLVLLEPWGEDRLIDLTASRRLALAARQSGVPVVLLRVAAEPAPGAAETRWRVAAMPSRRLEANAPGPPVFDLRLLRHRGGVGERAWCVEWNRDEQAFVDRSGERERPPLSRPALPFPARRPAQAGAPDAFRRAG